MHPLIPFSPILAQPARPGQGDAPAGPPIHPHPAGAPTRLHYVVEVVR